MTNKILSRKLILSVLLAVLATAFIVTGLITPIQWQWVIMSTAVSYVIANTVNKKTETAISTYTNVSFVTRLKALLSREFLVCVVTVIATSMLLKGRFIGGDVWFVICSALAGAYNIGNSVSKL